MIALNAATIGGGPYSLWSGGATQAPEISVSSSFLPCPD